MITVTYDSARTLDRIGPNSLPSDVEWIVIDNASADDSARAAERAGATRVIRLRDNRGFAAANNLALEVAKGRYVLFANPDLDFDPIDLPRLQVELDREPGLVSPQLINIDGTLQPNGRGFPTPLNKIRNRLPSARRSAYQIMAQPGQIKPVCFLMGASVATTIQFIRALGGWDERCFVYYEDHDLGFRAWDHGARVRVVGDINWTHGWARETKRLAFQPWRHEIRSAAPFFGKYHQLLLGSRAAAVRWPRIAAAIGTEARVNGSRRG